jgi:hypothetical protein
MDVWSFLFVAFMTGLTVGAAITFFCLKARLRFYRKFIEDRLSALNPPRAFVPAGPVR